MKTITLSAEDGLIEAAEERAHLEHTTLNEQFQIWLAGYAGRARQARDAMEAVAALRGKLRTGGRKFTREEMNER